ncbi:MAG TPA: DUF4013 domain-containing protein [Methanospirillum sp.]|nr:DUF4013 domain-containing protein [Methanospirillum sp.]
MDIRATVQESFEYTRETIWGVWKRWALLAGMSVIFPFILGYVMEIFRGRVPPPEIENWTKLFIDGLKYILVMIVYAIPVIIIFAASFMPIIMAVIPQIAAGNEPDINLPVLLPYMIPMLGGFVLAVLVGIIITFISSIGIIRMARTECVGEAFNISEILNTIRSIGWINYILALIVLYVIVGAGSFIVGLISGIPYIGWLISIFLGVPFSLYEARSLTLIYESADANPQSGSPAWIES